VPLKEKDGNRHPLELSCKGAEHRLSQFRGETREKKPAGGERDWYGKNNVGSKKEMPIPRKKNRGEI